MAFSRFIFTLFSWPEYVWTTYHFFDMTFSRASMLLAEQPEQRSDSERQEPVHDTDEDRHDQYGDDHDDGRVTQFVARRPADLRGLHLNFLQEFARPRQHPIAPVSFPPRRAGLRLARARRMAGLEGFEPPTPGFGDRCSSRTELQACHEAVAGYDVSRPLPRFLVRRVLAARRAVLLELDPVRMQALVLGRDVIPALAI